MKVFITKWKYYFIFAGIFSAFINILLLATPIHMLQIYDRVLASGSIPTLVFITAIALGALVIMSILEELRSMLLVLAGVDIDRTLGDKVLSGMINDASEFQGIGYAQGLQDVRILRNFLGGNSIFCIFDAPWTPFYLAIVFLIHVKLGILATVGAILIFIVGFLNEKITHKPLQKSTDSTTVSNREVGIYLRNAYTIRAMGMLQGITKRWELINNQIMSYQTVASNRGGLLRAFTKPLRMGLQVTLLATGAYCVIKHDVTAGAMIAGSIMMGRALAPVEMAIGTWKQMIEAKLAYNRLKELIAKEILPEVTTEFVEPQGRLTVESVVFGNEERPILKGVSLDLLPGEFLCLMGPNAAGKSTLGRLILRIWKPSSGLISMDGTDISKWDQDRFGKYIGYVPQDVELFSGTISDNIARMGEVNPEKVIAAAKLAQVHEMILRLPKGYDTQVGDRGVVLSGGQRQRVILARAIYDTPRLLVFDEPNSNLDDEGEKAFLQMLQILKTQKVTTVIISHKLNLLTFVDKILILKDGQPLMFGPRNEVLQKLIPPPQPVIQSPPNPVMNKTVQ
ncbi:MAG: type I secretion system permease/ATPase [Desulfobacterales bacterium]|nr:type I secretion system permease/ATPase [Desulfobacterales bacterium]